MIGSDEGLRKVCRNYHLVENYYKAIADEEMWQLHHRRETDEMKSRKQLIDEGKYYDVDPSELIFLTHSEHAMLHHKGKITSEDTKKKQSEAAKNRQPISEETRKKISKATAGENNPMYGKPGTMLGKHHSAETKKKMSEAALGEKNHNFGKLWWNDGKRNILSKEQPGPDFVRGRLKFNK